MIQRVLAPNAGPMTGTGTNTYLVERAGEVAVIDPGPDDSAHIEAILKAAEGLGRITAVLVTHRHEDHLPAARPLCARTGAPLLGHADLPGVDRAVADGEACFTSLEALTTPGHTRESLCFWDRSERALFTGDLVAGAGTVIVDDQPGALATTWPHWSGCSSSSRARSIQDTARWSRTAWENCANTSPTAASARHRSSMRSPRRGPSTVDDLVSAIYTDVAPGLVPMAARNVRAHLEKLVTEGRVAERQSRWQLTS